MRTPQATKFHEAQNVLGTKPKESLQRVPATTRMHPEEIVVVGEPFGGAATPWPPRYSHPPLLSSVFSGGAQLLHSHFPHFTRSFSTKQHNSFLSTRTGPDPGLRPVRHQALRTRERAPRTRFPADTHASVLDSPIAPLEYDQDPISGSAAQLGPCPSPPPASRRDRRDRTARAGCPVLTA